MIKLKPIGMAYTEATKVPNSWTISEVKGELVIDKRYIRRDYLPPFFRELSKIKTKV